MPAWFHNRELKDTPIYRIRHSRKFVAIGEALNEERCVHKLVEIIVPLTPDVLHGDGRPTILDVKSKTNLLHAA